MDMKKNAADRVRPILEAMERSIDSARRRRLGDHSQPTQHRTVTEGNTPATPTNNEPVAIPSEQNPQRLKAKPKRPSPGFGGSYHESPFQSKAG